MKKARSFKSNSVFLGVQRVVSFKGTTRWTQKENAHLWRINNQSLTDSKIQRPTNFPNHYSIQ